jgi:hypothetical protein
MGLKKIIFGEKMPDKDDPKYKEKYEKDVEAGKSFAQALRLDKGAACIQRFATNHSKLFLALVFAFVLFSVGLNLYRMSTAVRHQPTHSSAVERQEKELKMRRHHPPKQMQLQDSRIENSNNSYKIEEYEAYRKD